MGWHDLKFSRHARILFFHDISKFYIYVCRKKKMINERVFEKLTLIGSETKAQDLHFVVFKDYSKHVQRHLPD